MDSSILILLHNILSFCELSKLDDGNIMIGLKVKQILPLEHSMVKIHVIPISSTYESYRYEGFNTHMEEHLLSLPFNQYIVCCRYTPEAFGKSLSLWDRDNLKEDEYSIRWKDDRLDIVSTNNIVLPEMTMEEEIEMLK